MSNIAVEFRLYDDRAIDRVALGLAIKTSQRWLRAHLAAHGDDWLSPTDNPFISYIIDKCFLRMDSLKAPNGRLRMTYRTVLAIYEAYAEVFLEQGNAVESAMRMSVADIIVGHGVVAVTNPAPDARENGIVLEV